MKAEQIAIIKKTVPVLQEHGETLTRRFYENMFENNPEVKAFFNPAHQHSGSQQKALAGAICAYAQNIDNPAALSGAVELIAQKHTSLGILPEHYPIVGSNLLATIREVLGEAANDEIIDAWASAYGQLADIFISREKTLYQQHQQKFGWLGFKHFWVKKKQRQSDNITSFYLYPADGSALEPQESGQYTTVRVTLPDGATVMRNYSLSNAPNTEYYRISVKREAACEQIPAGRVSNFLQDQLQEGDILEIGPPCGEFVLHQPEEPIRPLVFIAGGVGVTPLLSMLHQALNEPNTNRPIYFIQAVRNSAEQPFNEELNQLRESHTQLKCHVRFSEPNVSELQTADRSTGYVDKALIDYFVDEKTAADFYICGPAPMLKQMIAEVNKRPAEDKLFYEFFGPTQDLK